MPTITLKNLPAVLHRKLKARAAANHRSLNAEAIACLEVVVAPARIDTNLLIDQARALRAQVHGHLDERTLKKLKESGRP